MKLMFFAHSNLFSRQKIFGWVLIALGLILGGLSWFYLPKVVYQPQPQLISQSFYFQDVSWLKEYPLVKIEKINDGDTFEVFLNGKRERIRLLGINTPEVESPYRHRECFGPEASRRGKQLLTGRNVYLVKDPAVPNRGRYGRLLRYAIREDGLFFNAEMIWEGYAFEYSPKGQHFAYESFFRKLEKQAQEDRRGLWGKCKLDF